MSLIASVASICRSFTKLNVVTPINNTWNINKNFLSTVSAVNFKNLLIPSGTSNKRIVRTRVMFNHLHGKPESVQDVVDRFYRLYNGLWIRPNAGRNKKKWKKSLRRLHRLQQHVFCNKTQCRKLDKMVNVEYKVPHYPVNDPYEVYHRKSNLPDYRYIPPKYFP